MNKLNFYSERSVCMVTGSYLFGCTGTSHFEIWCYLNTLALYFHEFTHSFQYHAQEACSSTDRVSKPKKILTKIIQQSWPSSHPLLLILHVILSQQQEHKQNRYGYHCTINFRVNIFRIFGTFSDELRVLIDHFVCML
jgi:hypothetical protein